MTASNTLKNGVNGKKLELTPEVWGIIEHHPDWYLTSNIYYKIIESDVHGDVRLVTKIEIVNTDYLEV